MFKTTCVSLIALLMGLTSAQMSSYSYTNFTSGNVSNSSYSNSSYSPSTYSGGSSYSYSNSTTWNVKKDKRCPYGCSVNGVCGTQEECAAADAIGTIIGLMVGAVVLVVFICLICCCCCGYACCACFSCCVPDKKPEKHEDDAFRQPGSAHQTPAPGPTNADAPFEGFHIWQGSFQQQGANYNFNCAMTVNEGNVSGQGQDTYGAYTIGGDTDGQVFTFWKEYQNGQGVNFGKRFYEGNLVDDRRQLQGNWGGAPGQMHSPYVLNLMN